MSIEHAKTIHGWMDHDDLAWLAANAAGRRLVVEFGSWCGRSSVALTTATYVLCVDTWEGSQEHAELLAAGVDPWKEWRTHTYQYPGVSAYKCDLAGDVSGLVSEVWARGGADMVFVDASHDYESVKRDIATARKLLKPGGLLSGHDYSRFWPGVMQAVDELVPSKRLHGSIWSEA